MKALPASVKPKVRCAIYTRKSTEEGLEQEFNSLDAQREACEAYVVSQKAEGWLLLGDRYDDGGFSGGSTDRPALQLYNSVWSNVAVPGLGGRRYGKHSGFCLEDQMYPDALHHAHFPSIIVSPDQPYSHWCEFEIA